MSGYVAMGEVLLTEASGTAAHGRDMGFVGHHVGAWPKSRLWGYRPCSTKLEVMFAVPDGVEQGIVVHVLLAIHGDAQSAVGQAWRRHSVGAAVVHVGLVGVRHLNRGLVV